MDHLTTSRRNLLETPPKIEIDRLSNCKTVLIYVTYGKHDFNVARIAKAFENQIIVIENTDDISKKIGSVARYYRKNRGFDLAAYRDGLNLLSRSEFNGNVLLINSSATWQISKLPELVQELEKTHTDEIMFMTRSHQGVEHFQTFFIWVPNLVLSRFHALVNSHWKNWRFKRSVVIFGEQKLFKLLNLYRISSNSYIDFSQVASFWELRNLNPSTRLIEKYVSDPIFRKIRR